MATKTEIERKFLLSVLPALDGNVRATSIEQGYFETPSSLDSFRVRIIGESTGVLTLKSGKGISREEVEEKISL